MIANNDNDRGLYTFSEDVRNIIKDFMTANSFFYDNELGDSVSYNPVTRGYIEDPVTIITPSISEYYAPMNGQRNMYKYMCVHYIINILYCKNEY